MFDDDGDPIPTPRTQDATSDNVRPAAADRSTPDGAHRGGYAPLHDAEGRGCVTGAWPGRCGHLLGGGPGISQDVAWAAVWPGRCGHLLGAGPGIDQDRCGYASGGGQPMTWHRRNHRCTPFPNRAPTAAATWMIRA